MKLYIKLDMEGISGIVHPDQVRPGNAEYERSRQLLMHDLISVLKGAFAAGATEALVYDMHADGRNVSMEAGLNARISIVAGRPQPASGFFYGLDDSFDALFLVGCHARAGAENALLPHTYDDDIVGIHINGTEIGEIGLEAALAGEFGIPLAFVSSDSGGVRETRELLGQDPEATQVKEAIGPTSGICMSAHATGRLLREAASRAVRRAGSVPLVVFPSPIRLEVTYDDPAVVARMDGMEQIELIDETTIATEGPNIIIAYRDFILANSARFVARRAA